MLGRKIRQEGGVKEITANAGESVRIAGVINEARLDEGLNQDHGNGDNIGRDGFKKRLVYKIVKGYQFIVCESEGEGKGEFNNNLWRFKLG